MKTYIARSIFETQAHLESALSADRQARQQAQAWISSQFQTNMTTALAALRQSSEAQGLARNQLESIQIERRKQVDELAHLVRDFFQVLRRRNQRLGLGPELEVLYKRPKRMPQSAPVIQWLQWGKDIVSGEELALDRGFPPMVNPSAADIQAVLSVALDSEQLWSERFQLLKASEHALRLARDRGTRVLRGLALRLRETLAHEAPPTRRELMRTYGFNFISTGAKERTKAKPGDSKLAVLIPPSQSLPHLLEEPSDRDQPNENVAIKPSQAKPAVVPHAVSLQPSQTPVRPSEDGSECDLQPCDTHTAPPASTNAVQQAAPKPDPLRTPTASQTQAARGKKLSRRQKKALRRAQQNQQHALAITPMADPSKASGFASWTQRVPA